MTAPSLPRQHAVAIDAIAYWQCVCRTSPNGWGQNLDAEYGVSHNLLSAMERRHGKARFGRALDILLGHRPK